MTMGVVVKIDLIFISSHRQNVWMKSHFPFSFPYCKFVVYLVDFIARYPTMSSVNNHMVDWDIAFIIQK